MRNRISRRDVVELCEQLFGSRISSGTVDAILARTADALAEPCDDLLERLRASRAVHMDEAGWRTAGQRRALWGIFNERHAYLHVARDHHEDHAKMLLGETKAIVTSDRSGSRASACTNRSPRKASRSSDIRIITACRGRPAEPKKWLGVPRDTPAAALIS